MARLAPSLNKLPESERSFVVEMIEHSITTTSSSPVPPPQLMAAYQGIYPEAPERFFDFADRQLAVYEGRVRADIAGEADHRAKNQTYRVLGMLTGALVSLSLIAAGVIVAVYGGSPKTGGFLAVVGVAAGLAGVFVQGRPLLDNDAPVDQPPPNKNVSATKPKPTSRKPMPKRPNRR